MSVTLSSDKIQHSVGLQSILSPWKVWVAPACLIVFLIFISYYNFLLFHIFSELFAIMVAVILSVVVWHTYQFSRNHYLMYLGTGYFWIGALDLMHTLSYKGMHIFEYANANTSTQFWITTRYFEALLLLTAPFFLQHSLNRTTTFILFGACSAIIYQIIADGHFPITYINSEGLTPFKIYSEYAIIALLITSIIYLNHYRNLIDNRIFSLMIISTLLTIIAETCFTLYVDVYGIFIFLGHIFKMLSFWFIFIAIIRTTLTEPYQIMAKGFSTYEAIPIPTIVVSKEGLIMQVNQAACDTINLKPNNILNKNCHELFHSTKTTKNKCHVCNMLRQGRKLQGYELYLKESNIWREYTLSELDMTDGVKAMVHVCADITHRKHIEEQLLFQANYDPLTSFPNRILAADRLKIAISHSKRNNSHTGIIFMDVDNFKNINDTLGHSIGDMVLIKIANRISTAVRESDTVARWGGDEFLIILPNQESTLKIGRVANKILQSVGRAMTIDNHNFNISASIGISSYPDNGITREELLSYADVAMYEAKNAGKNTLCFYSEEMSLEPNRKMIIESELRYAIEKNELYVVYQPQIDIIQNKIVGAEVLLRWKNNKLGLVPPITFIPIAEESGLIHRIGDWVLERIGKDYHRLHSSKTNNMRISINISSRQLKNNNFITKVKHLIDCYNIPPNNILIEITESALLGDDKITTQVIKSLRQMGFNLSLDDFGTGYSSLSYLKKLPFSEIKIDRSFVRDCVTDPSDAALCKAIIAMAESLNLRVVSEGVETIEQLDFFKQEGALIVQGNYFSIPLTLDDFIEFADNNSD